MNRLLCNPLGEVLPRILGQVAHLAAGHCLSPLAALALHWTETSSCLRVQALTSNLGLSDQEAMCGNKILALESIKNLASPSDTSAHS